MVEQQFSPEQLADQERVYDLLPRPVIKVLSDPANKEKVDKIYKNASLKRERKEKELVTAHLPKVEDLPREECTIEVTEYRTGSISFANLYAKENPFWHEVRSALGSNEQSENLINNLQRELQSQLLSAFVLLSDNNWPASRTPGEEYVFVDFEPDDKKMAERLLFFFNKVMPTIVRNFYDSNLVEVLGEKKGELDMADFMLVAVGQANKTEDKTPMPLVAIIADDGVVYWKQEVYADPKNINPFIGAKGSDDINQAYKTAKQAGKKALPLITTFTSGQDTFSVDLKKKGVSFDASLVSFDDGRWNGLFGLEELSEDNFKLVRQDGDDSLKDKMSATSAESYVTPQELIYHLQKNDQEYQSFLEGAQAQLAFNKMEVANQKLDFLSNTTSGASFRGGEIAGVDLSGMSKISSRIAEYAQSKDDRFNIDMVRKGWQQFLSKWQGRLVQLYSSFGFKCDEIGGDGLKAIYIDDKPMTAVQRVFLSTQVNAAWQEMSDDIRKGEASDDKKELLEFVRFVRSQEDEQLLQDVFMKSGMCQTDGRLVVHGCGMVELFVDQDIDVALELVKSYFKGEAEKARRLNFKYKSPVVTAIDSTTYRQLIQEFDDSSKAEGEDTVHLFWDVVPVEHSDEQYYLLVEKWDDITKKVRETLFRSILEDKFPVSY